MKKLLSLVCVSALLILCAGAALAEWQRDVGTIIEVQDNGDLLVEMQSTLRTTVHTDGARIDLPGDPTPRMSIEVQYDGEYPQPGDVVEAIDATLIRPAYVIGEVIEVDAAASMVQIYANGGVNCLSVWIVLPKDVDVEALWGTYISAVPYREFGDPASETVEAYDYITLDRMSGNFKEVTEDTILLDVDGKTVTVTLTDDTLAMRNALQNNIGYPGDVYYAPTEADTGDVPDAVEAAAVFFGNG